ncbi:hypothetical protein QX51_15365 [Terrisporobacter othiniensis]|uniref:Uncharacterized protein n=1 Tax=Terrisporobacter othiniensis TaxID=1577792 RepID=A0A0B3WNW3_9FIRM|nr:hypothetical protein QX51_15365 [Terrisporobacter othiniensis]
MLVKYLKKALYSSREFHTLIFDDNENTYKVNSAIAHLNQAHTYIHIANSLYIQHSEPGECSEFETAIHQFDVFNKEFLSSYSTNHSLQWTDIEFRKFEEDCNNFLEIFKF